MPKNDNSQNFDFDLLKTRLTEIEEYVAEIKEHMALLEIACSVKPAKARLLLKLYRQNVDSYLSEIGSFAYLSKRAIEKRERG